MNIIISPAKQMKVNSDDIEILSLPYFIDDAYIIRNKLKNMTKDELKKLWKCNDKILNENIDRLKDYELTKNLTPAIIAYDGLQYKKMVPNVFTDKAWKYVDEHLFILSAMYGALKPREGVIPYRLEMQAELEINGNKNLYKYWNDRIYKRIINNDDNVILNLASKEYSDVITPYIDKNHKIITCEFCQNVNGKLIQRSTEAKSCRGAMVRYLAENNINNLDDVKKFNEFNYKYSEKDSNDITMLFIKH